MKRLTTLLMVPPLAAAVFSALAGNLDSPAAPSDAGSAMYTLGDLYSRLNAGTAGAKRAGAFVEPAAGPAATGYTLDEVMAKAPLVDDSAGATAAEVLSGKRFWGLRGDGTWGPTGGTMANVGAQSITPGTTAQAITRGYHSGAGSVAGDADLVAGNIKSGVTLFGVSGDYPAAAVQATGQTSCFDEGGTSRPCAGTGEDGEKKAGVASPSPRFTKHGNGTVTDNLTGLIWLANANCAGVLGSWQQALNYVASLNSTGFMGMNYCGDGSNGGSHQTDWRLPSAKELMSLVNYAYIDPSISNAAGTAKWVDGDPFTGVSNDYWTSTTRLDSPGVAYLANTFLGALSGSMAKTATNGAVWAVRGGQMTAVVQ